MLKLFSFKQPIVINSDKIVVNDLAYNHKYVKENRYGKTFYKVVGNCAKGDYCAFYNLKGEIFLIETKTQSSSRALLPWTLIKATSDKRKILASGNMFTASNHYQTTDSIQRELVKKSFSLILQEVEYNIEFVKEDGKWIKQGFIPSEIRNLWLKELQN